MANKWHTKRITAAIVFAMIPAALFAADPKDPAVDVNSMELLEQDALQVVARRIAGYNAHDIDEFLAAHSEHVEIFVYPDKKIGAGRDHLRFIFESQFAREAGHVEVTEQFALESTVVSREVVTVEGETEHLVAIYTVENGVITAYRLIETTDP